VATLIAGSDMAAFYRQRTDYPPQPDAVDQRIIEWFKDSDWVATFTHTTDTGIQLPLLVSGMSCAACTWVIEKFLLKLPDVLAVDINLSLSRVVITLAPECDPAKAIETLLTLGYRVRLWRTDERLEQLRRESRRDLRRLGVAGLGMMQVGMFAIALHAGDMQGIAADMKQLLRASSAPLALFVLIYSGRSFFENAWRHLKQGALVMDSSVALALLIATAASLWSTLRGGGETYYDSVTMFIFFLLLARFAEKRLRDADLIALARLEDGLPEFLTVWRTDAWCRAPRDQINPGDRLRIAAGEAIAFDGEVIEGESAVEESVFNGESIPRSVISGDTVFAGTVNREATLEIRVTSSYRDSRLAALAQEVERARREKPPYLQLIDRIAARFVAFILLAATTTCLAWLWIDADRAVWSALAVLVVACPCALSLATPAAMAGATARLRREGILVKGEFGLLAAAEASRVVIDKTGTLTQTELVIDTAFLNRGVSQEEAISLAAAMQQASSHPAAKAFHHLPTEHNVERVQVIPGAGIEGWCPGSGQNLRLGSEAFCRELALDLPPPPDAHHYWIALVNEAHWLAWLGLAEHLRTGAHTTITQLQTLGLAVEILSGDSPARVQAIAQQLSMPIANASKAASKTAFTEQVPVGIAADQGEDSTQRIQTAVANTATHSLPHSALGWRGALSPSDKLAVLQQYQQQNETVLAVGDGLNDAPLLSAADASVAVAGATALARAQADFVVLEDDLTRIPVLIRGARAARRIMRQNLWWAASYNLIGIPFAALGYVPPWVAAIGMSLSSLLVVLNALRLRRDSSLADTSSRLNIS